MRIRFLQTTESLQSAYPFQVGQVITVDKVTAYMRAWLTPADGSAPRAEIVRDGVEAATLEGGERATLPPANGRRA